MRQEEKSQASFGTLIYTVVRSARRSISLSVDREGSVIVRAPRKMTDAQISEFVAKHERWLLGALARAEERRSVPEPTEEEIVFLRARAKRELPPKIEYYARRMNVVPTGFRVTSAKTRFGSCSPKNSLSFSLYLMRWPEEAIDYVVVHELAHRRQMNHSRRFYEIVERYLPDYRDRVALMRTFPRSL